VHKKALIFGDSYSTFEGCVPDGYAIYYFPRSCEYTDVREKEQTWWHRVMAQAGLELVLNNSWSGSTVGYTGYDNADTSASSSFIFRLRRLIDEGFFAENRIDTAFVFGGTNDSWADAPLGEPKFENWEESDLYFVLPAVCYFLWLLKQTLPEARLYCLINTELKQEISDCMRAACARYGITAVTFEHIDKSCGHPTIRGMQDIADTVLQALAE
jgi:hypothetical protein